VRRMTPLQAGKGEPRKKRVTEKAEWRPLSMFTPVLQAA
jgi:hypothetical protein